MCEGFVVFFVERGWRAHRECGLELQRRGIGARFWIKGRIPRGVKELIRPHPLISIADFSERFFRMATLVRLAALCLRPALRGVVVDREKTESQLRGLCRLARKPLLRVSEGSGTPAWKLERDGAPAAIEAFENRL